MLWPGPSCQVTSQPLIPAVKPKIHMKKTKTKINSVRTKLRCLGFPCAQSYVYFLIPLLQTSSALLISLPPPSHLLFGEVRGRYVLVQVRTQHSAAVHAGKRAWHHYIPHYTKPLSTTKHNTKHMSTNPFPLAFGRNLNSMGMEGCHPFF